MQTTVETWIGGAPQQTWGRMTTPSASHVQRTLAAMVAAGDQCCVLESSSHALVQDRLRNVVYRGAAITNIASDHLDFHGSHEHYVNAKASLLTMVEEAQDAHIALNADDANSMDISRRLAAPYMLYGVDSTADVMARSVEVGPGRIGFVLDAHEQSAKLFLPISGDYNVYNALAAATLALSEGIPVEVIKSGLETGRVPPGRLQPVECGQRYDVFVDYAHTEQALEKLLGFLSTMAHGRGGRLLAVFGAAGDRDRSKRRNLARIAQKYSDFFVITNEDPFNEDPEAIMTEIARGANPEERGSRWTIEGDRRRALTLAFGMARPGDVVAVTGKGHEHAIAVGSESVPWNDAEVIEDLLSERS
jgi:UDP-N-acetylmuramoyl-L-alanyl-D-glutamate--2,6-diaminopimelate ligase